MGKSPDNVTGRVAFPPAQGELAPDRTSRREAMLGWMEEIAPFGILTTDADLNIRSWNRWLVAHSGLTAEAVMGRPLLEVFPDVATRRLEENFRRALGGQIAVLSTALHRYLLPFPPVTREFGVSHMLQTARIAPLPAQGEIVGTLTIIEDVTQRECQAQILRRQQEHDRLLSSALALLLESENPLQVAQDLFPRIAAPLRLEAYFNFLVSPDGEELRLHAAGGITAEVRRAMATVKLGEGVCGQVAALRRPILIPSVQATTDRSMETIRRLGLRAYASFPLMMGDRLLGTLSFGSYEREVIASDEIEFLTRVAQYLSIAFERALREQALREAQASLREHAESLETRIAERTAKLHETIQQLESFSYTIAHDLRAPIRSLKGYSEILLTDYGALVPEDGKTMLQRLLRASHRLDALTRDLLKFSRIARADVELAMVDVTEVVQDIIAASPTLHESLDLRPPLGVALAQRTLLQQCLSNLFENALKFSQPGVPARVVVRSERLSAQSAVPALPSTAHPFNPPTSLRDAVLPDRGEERGMGERLRIWVEDNGIGIAPQAHQKIFGIFERVSGLDHVEGTGIGLAIVARAMQQMGGSCGVVSTLGSGARFWLDLQLNADANPR